MNFFIKRNLGFLLINYRFLRIKYFCQLFFIFSLMSAHRFLTMFCLILSLDNIFIVKKKRIDYLN